MRLILDTTYSSGTSPPTRSFRPPSGRPASDPANEVYLSVASVWEAVIKYHLGKLPLPAPPADYLARQGDAHGIASLPIDEGATPYLAGLPPIHRDPCDRASQSAYLPVPAVHAGSVNNGAVA